MSAVSFFDALLAETQRVIDALNQRIAPARVEHIDRLLDTASIVLHGRWGSLTFKATIPERSIKTAVWAQSDYVLAMFEDAVCRAIGDSLRTAVRHEMREEVDALRRDIRAIRATNARLNTKFDALLAEIERLKAPKPSRWQRFKAWLTVDGGVRA